MTIRTDCAAMRVGPRIGGPRFLHIALAALILAATAGCNRSGLANSYRSPERLAGAVLEALAHADRAALTALMVTREEHRDLLWEQLPESKTYSFEYARAWNERNSNAGIGRAISRYGGTTFELLEIEFTEPSEEYSDFRVHFGTKLRVRRLRDGRAGELPILDVVLERKGRWKLMNYES